MARAYADFAKHLSDCYRCIVNNDDCLIYRLVSSEKEQVKQLVGRLDFLIRSFEKVQTAENAATRVSHTEKRPGSSARWPRSRGGWQSPVTPEARASARRTGRFSQSISDLRSGAANEHLLVAGIGEQVNFRIEEVATHLRGEHFAK